jgi:hypothetical protein
MNWFQRLGAGIMAGLRTFNSAFFSSDESNAVVFESNAARMQRYTVGFGFYEGNQYSSLWSNSFKVSEGLYKYIQNLYNPTAREVDFWKAAIWRGSLNADAGTRGAIPIKIGAGVNEAQLRAAIAHCWSISNWDVYKAVHVLHGTTMGDAAIYIRHDPDNQQVRKEILHPSLIKYVELDARGFVKRYILAEPRLDENKQVSTYIETCEHGEGEEILFKTYRVKGGGEFSVVRWDDYKGNLWAWEGNNDKNGDARSEWSEPYGFVPLVLVQHINDGRMWGRSEIQPYIKKIAAIDDQASILDDSLRRILDPDYQANFQKSDTEVTFVDGTPTVNKPKIGREQRKIFYTGANGNRIEPITVDIDVEGAVKNITMMLDNLEKDLPELMVLKAANVTEETFFGMRDTVEAKVWERRAAYDKGEVRSLQMMIAIGGQYGYPGYEGFDLSSYKAGRMDFSIAERPVFPVSDSMVQKQNAAFLAAVSSAMQASQGMITFAMAAKIWGWSDEKIAELMEVQKMSISNGESIPTDPTTGERMEL